MGFQMSDKQKWLLAGAAAIVIFVVILKSRSKGSSGGTAQTVIPAMPVGSTTGASAISAGQLGQFESQLTGTLDTAIGQMQSTIAASGSTPAASGSTPPTSSAPPVSTGGGFYPTPTPTSISPATLTATAPAPTYTATAAPPVVTPSPPVDVTPVGPPSGSVSINGQTLNYISSPQEGSVLAAAGDTIDAVIAGTVVPVVVGGQRTAAWNSLPSGTRLYDSPSA